MNEINIGLIDTHCHLTDKKYKDNDRSLLLKRIFENEVSALITVGVNYEDSLNSIFIATEHENVFASFGIHPSEIVGGAKVDKKVIEKIREYSQNPKLIAIGECGLDYYWDDYEDHKDNQIKEFIKQLEISIELNLPIILHVRDAHDDMIKILSKYPKAKGVIHCFTGNEENAKEYIKLGFYISFSGIITFKNATNITNVIKNIPLDRLLVETDSPYLTPEPFRGQKNYPYFLKHIVDKLSKTVEISYQQMVAILSENSSRLFNI